MNPHLAITVAMTLLPSILLFLYIYTHDEHPEPKGLVLKIAIFGALAAIPVVLTVLAINEYFEPVAHPLLAAAYFSFVEAAIPEEVFKLLVVLIFAYRHSAFDEPFDGIVYCATASLGFATLENILYVSSGGLPLAIGRALTAVPLHAFCGVIMGYYVGQARFSAGVRNVQLWFCALVYPIFFHGLYNWTIFSFARTENFLFLVATVAVLLGTIVVAVRMIRLMDAMNLPILARYHGISREEMGRILPKGAMSEDILPQITQFLSQASPIRYPPSPPREIEPFSHVPSSEAIPIPPRRSRGFVGVLMVLIGIILTTSSTVLLLGLFVGMAMDEDPMDGPTTVGMAIFTLIFLFFLFWGVRLFWRGLRRNRD